MDDDDLMIGEGERGIVRVFAVDVPEGEAERWTNTDSPGWPLPHALGLRALNARDVQVFSRRDLGGLSLADFLQQGYDITDEQLASDRVTLDSAEGVFAVLRSGAFPHRPVSLALERHVRLLGTFAEPSAAPASSDMGDYQSARPGGTPEPKPARGVGAPQPGGFQLPRWTVAVALAAATVLVVLFSLVGG